VDLTNRQHSVSGGDHSITGSQYQIVGATGTNTLGLLTPLADVSGATKEAILKSDSNGYLTLVRAVLSDRLRTPLVDTASGDLTLQPASRVVMATGKDIQLSGYVSQTTGWRIDSTGGADFRYLFVDELHAKAFIADLEQALAGGQIISKSVAMLGADFTAPAAGGTATLTVRDLPSAPNMAVFQSGDIVRLRTFNRSGGSLTIADCWGVVTAYADQPNGTQTWTFTRSTAPNAGAITAGTVMPTDSIALDYGTTGNGFYEVNAIDGNYAVNSPYAQIVSWSSHPATGQTVRLRLGNLRGLFSQPNEYGMYAGDGTGSTNAYLRLSNLVNLLQNIPIKQYESGTLTTQVSTSGGLALQAYTLSAPNNEYRAVSWYDNLGAGTGQASRLYTTRFGGQTQARWDVMALSGDGASNGSRLLMQTIAPNGITVASADFGADDASGYINLNATNVRINGSTIWHAGNDGSGSGLDADLLDGIDSTNINNIRAYGWSASAGTWYRIARTAQGGGRGPGRILVYSGGGTTAARTAVIDLLGSWGGGSDTHVFVRTNAAGAGWSQYRITSDATYKYLEVYFDTANTYYCADIYRLHSYDSWYAIQPTTGGGTVELAAFTDYDFSVHNVSSARINGYDIIPGGWQTPTLDSNWAAFGAPYRSPAYRRVGDVVIISGLIKMTTTTTGSYLFNIPSGFRPGTQLIFSCMSYLPSTGTNEGRRIDVKSNGDVVWSGWTPEQNTWISLEITFSK